MYVGNFRFILKYPTELHHNVWISSTPLFSTLNAQESSERAADREAAREFAQRRALSSEKQTAKQSVIESSERAESLAKKLEATIQQNLELCRKVDQLTSSQVKHKSGGRTPTADTGLVKIFPEGEAVEEEYARRIMEKDQLLAQAVEEAEILRERLGLMEAEGPVSQVVQDMVMQETESQNEGIDLDFQPQNKNILLSWNSVGQLQHKTILYAFSFC